MGNYNIENLYYYKNYAMTSSILLNSLIWKWLEFGSVKFVWWQNLVVLW